MRRIRVALVIAALFAGAAVSLHAEAIVPAGTPIVMTLDQSVSSKDARTGQKVDCTVAQNVVVGGKTVIPKGSRGSCSVASVQASGHLKTPAKLWLKIDSIEVNGKTFTVSTRWSGRPVRHTISGTSSPSAAAPRREPSSAPSPAAAKAPPSEQPQAPEPEPQARR